MHKGPQMYFPHKIFTLNTKLGIDGVDENHCVFYILSLFALSIPEIDAQNAEIVLFSEDEICV